MATILLIDDDLTIRETVCELLSLEGFDVMAAPDGLIGVQMAQRHLPDLIISDVMMPKLNGYGVLERLEADPRTASIPVIFLTAKDASQSKRVHSAQLVAYMTKPFTIESLLEQIRQHVV